MNLVKGNYEAVARVLESVGFSWGVSLEQTVYFFSRDEVLDALCRFRDLAPVTNLRAENAKLKARLDGKWDGARQLEERLHKAEAERDALKRDVERLEGFKAYVHQRLDEMGMPANPGGPHSEEGCRVGDRLDAVARNLDREANHKLGIMASLHRLLDEAEVPPATSVEHRVRVALGRLHDAETIQNELRMSLAEAEADRDDQKARIVSNKTLLSQLHKLLDEAGIENGYIVDRVRAALGRKRPSSLPPGHDWERAKTWWSIYPDDFDRAALDLLAWCDTRTEKADGESREDVTEGAAESDSSGDEPGPKRVRAGELPPWFDDLEKSAYKYLHDRGCTGWSVDLTKKSVTYIDGEETKHAWNLVGLKQILDSGEWDGNIPPDEEDEGAEDEGSDHGSDGDGADEESVIPMPTPGPRRPKRQNTPPDSPGLWMLYLEGYERPIPYIHTPRPEDPLRIVMPSESRIYRFIYEGGMRSEGDCWEGPFPVPYIPGELYQPFGGS